MAMKEAMYPYRKEMLDRHFEIQERLRASIREEILLSESFWKSGTLQGLIKPINIQTSPLVKGEINMTVKADEIRRIKRNIESLLSGYTLNVARSGKFYKIIDGEIKTRFWTSLPFKKIHWNETNFEFDDLSEVATVVDNSIVKNIEKLFTSERLITIRDNSIEIISNFGPNSHVTFSDSGYRIRSFDGVVFPVNLLDTVYNLWKDNGNSFK